MGRPLQYWRSWSLLNARCDVIERVVKEMCQAPSLGARRKSVNQKLEFLFFFPLFILPSFEQMMKA
jgi:hypothetical protein